MKKKKIMTTLISKLCCTKHKQKINTKLAIKKLLGNNRLYLQKQPLLWQVSSTTPPLTVPTPQVHTTYQTCERVAITDYKP